MSDSFATVVTFGGTLKRSELDALAELTSASGGYPDWDDGAAGSYDAEQLVDDAEAGRPALITDHQARYDTYDELCVWLTSRDLSWTWQQDAKYEFDGERRVWFPGMDKPAESLAAESGEALIALSALRTALERGQTMAEFVAAFAPFEREIPPLVLVD